MRIRDSIDDRKLDSDYDDVMQIIDFKRKGNLVRFYLGDVNDNGFWGNGWNERPYEAQSNNSVYDKYIKGVRDIVFPFDAIVCEPSDGHKFSRRSKRDMKGRRCPCIVVMMPDAFDKDEYSWVYIDDFDLCAGDGRSVKFYFGDRMRASNEITEYSVR